jgi:2'-5' RNA ligase
MKNKRTFIAIPVPEHIRGILREVQEYMEPVSRGVKWVDPELMHITLKFLGGTPERLLEDVGRDFREITAKTEAFKLQLKDLGHFPRTGDPRVLWAGLQKVPGRVYRLSDELNTAFLAYNFDDTGKRFSPHITLGRVKKKLHPDFTEQYYQIDLKEEIFEVDRIIWYESCHKEGKLQYLPLEEQQLKST